MPVWLPILVTIGLAIATASLGFAFRTMREITALKARHDTLIVEHSNTLNCIPVIQQDIATLKQNDEVFWKVIGPHMSGIIQSPDHVNRDHLVNRLDEGSLTYQQALELNSMLGHALQDEKRQYPQGGPAFKLAQVRCLLINMERQG